MRRILTTSVILISSALVLSACNDSEKAEADAAKKAATEAAESAAAAKKKADEEAAAAAEKARKEAEAAAEAAKKEAEAAAAAKAKLEEEAKAANQCAWEGCENPGAHKAPMGRNREGQYLNMCIDHVRLYNKN